MAINFLKAEWREWMTVLLISVVITLVVTAWIGDVTIYASELEARRLFLHDLILRNELPPGKTWSDFGGNGTNIRILTVVAADWLSVVTGITLLDIYKSIDTICLLGTLLLVYVYLKRWFAPAYALSGLLVLGLILPLTMMLHGFHPWDRPSLLMWIIMILLVLSHRLVLFLAAYLVAIGIKYDALVAPGMYWLLSLNRPSFWRPTAITTGLVTIGLLTYAALRFMIPGGFEGSHLEAQIARNVGHLLQWNPPHQGILAHGTLGLLCVTGWSQASYEQRSLAVFGALLLIPHFVMTNFQELRAQMSTVLLMLPCAIAGVRAVFSESRSSPAQTGLEG